MNCKECPSFKIRYHLIKDLDSGMAACEKYHMVVDFMSNRKMNRLVCVMEQCPKCGGSHMREYGTEPGDFRWVLCTDCGWNSGSERVNDSEKS